MNLKIELIQGDITKVNVDAIVNAANSSLLGGSGVDGAIHKAGGKSILEECIKIRNKKGSCKTGEVVLTSAGTLPAKFVIHAVGPVWSGGKNNEENLLSLTYSNALSLAIKNLIKTIAFPNISTGTYRFPKQKAAEIAVRTVINFSGAYKGIEKIIFVCHDPENYSIYKRLLNAELH